MPFQHGGTLFEDHTHPSGLILPADLDPAFYARITDIEADLATGFPLGIGTWATWTPTYANLTKGDGTVLAEYQRVGKLVFYVFKFILGATSAVGTNPTFLAPVTPDANHGSIPMGQIRLADANGPEWEGQARLSGTNDLLMLYQDGLGNQVSITAIAPFTWASGDVLGVCGFYRVT